MLLYLQQYYPPHPLLHTISFLFLCQQTGGVSEKAENLWFCLNRETIELNLWLSGSGVVVEINSALQRRPTQWRYPDLAGAFPSSCKLDIIQRGDENLNIFKKGTQGQRSVSQWFENIVLQIGKELLNSHCIPPHWLIPRIDT